MELSKWLQASILAIAECMPLGDSDLAAIKTMFF